MKRCIKCSIEKDDGDFLENRNTCKECRREYNKQWREANAAEIKQKQKQWREANAPEIKQKAQQYHEANAVEIKQKKKQYREANAPEIKQKAQQYREANAPEIKQKAQQYHEANAVEIKQKKKQYREANAVEIKQKKKQWREANPAKKMLFNARERSKQKGMPFDITEDDLINIWPTHCPVLGIELQLSDKGKAQSNSFSLDRIDSDPHIGYIPKNIRIISNRANTLKSNATLEELFQLGKDAEKLIEAKAKKNE